MFQTNVLENFETHFV